MPIHIDTTFAFWRRARLLQGKTSRSCARSLGTFASLVPQMLLPTQCLPPSTSRAASWRGHSGLVQLGGASDAPPPIIPHSRVRSSHGRSPERQPCRRLSPTSAPSPAARPRVGSLISHQGHRAMQERRQRKPRPVDARRQDRTDTTPHTTAKTPGRSAIFGLADPTRPAAQPPSNARPLSAAASTAPMPSARHDASEARLTHAYTSTR